MAVEIQLLGPVDALLDGRTIDLRGPRQRRLLAKLALRPGTLVDGSELIDAIWPDGELPVDPRETLRTYASRLRNALGAPETVVGRASGYLLTLQPEAIDAHRFETLLSNAANTFQHEDRIERFDAALALWHGPALAGFENEDWARASAVRWTELRDSAVDDHAQTLIECARYERAVAVLEAATQDRPLRERTHRLLMSALQLSGRQAEALRVFSRYRHRLATDLGLDPGEEIRELESRIAASTEHGLEGAPLGGRVRGYRVIERIGDGAFSVVYRGEQPAVNRPVAIKVIRSELANRADFIRRFEAEAHLVARLEHPHIVPLYDYWREPGSAYLVMRLLPTTLEEQITKERLSASDALGMLDQIGAALEVAHRAGVVHRDVKPGNIFGDGEGNWFLADFGIAVQSDLAYRIGDLASIGSPAYAPPEQLRREPVGPAADVYGLAMVLYESLTGSLPFPEARNQAELLKLRLHEPLPSLRSLRPDVPALDEVLRRATATEPSDRYLTIGEMVTACHDALDDRPTKPHNFTGRATLVSEISRNPYKGLRAFQEADASDFYGRHRLTERLLKHLAEAGPTGRILTVVGPSGSGKSSVVRAGLLPAIRSDGIRGSSRWFVTSMVPGAYPFEELEVALARIATGATNAKADSMMANPRGVARAVRSVLPTEQDDLLLVIDQFEELFTLCADDVVRRSFIEGLTAAVSEPRSRLRVVLTLRADFYDRPLRYPEFAPLIESGTVVVSPLTAEELERAIVEPAESVGASFEPGLVARIIADFVDQPGALPLLQYAMTELFANHVAGVLTAEAYEKLGGLAGVLGHRAESLYLAAPDEVQRATRRAMARLVALGEGTEDTRRRVRRSELGFDTPTESFVSSFGDVRLLSFDTDPVTREPTVEVAHEALIREWPRLREWLDDNRDGLRVHRHLTEAAASWVAGVRDEGDLLRGTRLETTALWAAAHNEDLNEIESEFLAASSTLHRAEVEAAEERVRVRERQHRRLRRALLAVGLVATVAVLASAVALQQRTRANDKAEAARNAAFLADTGRIQSEAAQLATTNPRVALLLAAEAHRRDPGPESLGALQQALIGSGSLLGYFKGGVSYGKVTWIDDHRFAAARLDGVDLFEDTGEILRTIDTTTETNVLTASVDGRFLAIADRNRIRIVDLQERTTEDVSIEMRSLIQAVAFSVDGRQLAVGTGDGDAIVYDTASGGETWRVRAHTERTVADLQLKDAVADNVPHVALSAIRGVSVVAFLPNANRLVTGGFGFIRIFQIGITAPDASQPLLRQTGGRTVAAVPRSLGVTARDQTVEIIASDQTSAWRLDPNSARVLGTTPLQEFPTSAGTLVAEYEVSVAGRSVVQELVNGTVNLVDIDRGPNSLKVEAFVPNAHGLAYRPTSHRLLVSSSDGIAFLATDGDTTLSRAYPIGSGDLFVTDDGRTIANSDLNLGEAHLWRVDGDNATEVPLPGRGALAVSPTTDKDTVALLDEQLGGALVHAKTGELKLRFPGWTFENWLIAFAMSKDHKLVAWAGVDGRVQLRSVADGTLLREFTEFQGRAFRELPRIFDFDYRGRRLLATTPIGRAILWDLQTGATTTLSEGGSDFVQATFSPDGKHVASLAIDGTVTLRDANTLQPTGVRLVGNTASSNLDYGPYFSSDSSLIATAADGRFRLWDAATGKQIGRPFPSDQKHTAGASPNLRWIVTGRDGHVDLWNIDVERWPELACRASGRNMTIAEWKQFGPRSVYRATCAEYGAATNTEEPTT